jgi:hypothetical protein
MTSKLAALKEFQDHLNDKTVKQQKINIGHSRLNALTEMQQKNHHAYEERVIARHYKAPKTNNTNYTSEKKEIMPTADMFPSLEGNTEIKHNNVAWNKKLDFSKNNSHDKIEKQIVAPISNQTKNTNMQAQTIYYLENPMIICNKLIDESTAAKKLDQTKKIKNKSYIILFMYNISVKFLFGIYDLIANNCFLFIFFKLVLCKSKL